MRTPFIGRKLLKLLLYISCLSQMEIYNHRVTILRNFKLLQKIVCYFVFDLWCICALDFDKVGCWEIVCPWCYSIWTFITLWKCKQTICMNYTFRILLKLRLTVLRTFTESGTKINFNCVIMFFLQQNRPLYQLKKVLLLYWPGYVTRFCKEMRVE